MLLICYLNTMDHCCFYCAKPCQEICNDCQIYAFCSPEHKEYHQVNNTCLPFKVLHYIHNKCLNCLLHFFSKYLSSCFCFSNSSQKMLGSMYLLFKIDNSILQNNCHKIWQFIVKIEVDSIDFEYYKVNLQDNNSAN